MPIEGNNTQESSPKFLFVKLRHIGDALILTPTLSAVKKHYPNAVIDVVVRSGTQGILSGCTAINTIYTTSEPETKNRSNSQFFSNLNLLRQIRKNKYDYAFDMTSNDRSRFMIGFSKAKTRSTNIHHYPLRSYLSPLFNQKLNFSLNEKHQIERDHLMVAEGLGIKDPPPVLEFAEERTEAIDENKFSTNSCVMHISTRWKRKEWPIERWAEVGKYLESHFDQLVISVGPSDYEVEYGKQLAGMIGSSALCTEGKLNFSQLAKLLYRSQFFVGVDTAVMHLASACKTPMVALFGPTNIKSWKPWNHPNAIIVSPEHGEDLKHLNDRTTDGIATASVIEACDTVIKKAQH